MHFDGAGWTTAPVPNVSLVDGQFLDVSADAPNDAWVVGVLGTEHGERPLIEHWNGREWSASKLDATFASITETDGVLALSPHNVWAVGREGAAPLVLHWNGATWAKVSSPDLRSPRLAALTRVANSPSWMAGTTYKDLAGRGPTRAVIERFKEGKWQLGRLLGEGTAIETISAHGAQNTWALGSTGNWAKQVLLHFDGGAWHTVAAPGQAALFDVQAASGPGAWIVGTDSNTPQQAFAARWAC
jgi:hypothetical protein